MKQSFFNSIILVLSALPLHILEEAKSCKFARVIMNTIKAALFLIFSIFFANSSFAQVNINYASGDVISCGAVDGVIPNLTADDDTIAKELRCLTDLEELKLSLSIVLVFVRVSLIQQIQQVTGEVNVYL